MKLKLLYYKIRAKIFYLFHPTNTVKLDHLKREQYNTPSMMIFHSTFQTLVNYVENTLARATTTKMNSSMLTRLKMNFFPRSLRRNISRELGIKALQTEISLDVPELAKVKNNLIELYTWYLDEYPVLELRTNPEKEPEHCCIDMNGNPVDTMLTVEEDTFVANKISEEYMRYLETEMEIESNFTKIIEQKLQELLSLRHIMI